MRHTLILIVLLLQSFTIMAQGNISDLKISILTCASGKEIYASFGHCAFRATSKSRLIDRVYNYGTFDYQQPYFVLKFVRGFLDYSESAYAYQRFAVEYIREKRQVNEQVLDLTPDQAQAMYDFLEWNALLENRNYKYNFLEDNCATKIRDVIKYCCGDNVIYPDSTYSFSLRDGINERIKEMPWFRLGINLLMGLPVDKKATSQTAMFLPDYVYYTLNDTKIKDNNGNEKKIVAMSRTVVQALGPVDRTDITTYISPSLVFWTIFAIWAWFTYKEWKNKTYNALGDKILLCIVGTFGILLFVMWFFTEHTVTANNLNILWALPTHIVAAWFVKSNNKFWQYYFKTTAITTAILMLTGYWSPQHYDIAFYPILLIITMRLATLGFLKKNKIK